MHGFASATPGLKFRNLWESGFFFFFFDPISNAAEGLCVRMLLF